jgi:hypothetical protein
LIGPILDIYQVFVECLAPDTAYTSIYSSIGKKNFPPDPSDKAAGSDRSSLPHLPPPFLLPASLLRATDSASAQPPGHPRAAAWPPAPARHPLSWPDLVMGAAASNRQHGTAAARPRLIGVGRRRCDLDLLAHDGSHAASTRGHDLDWLAREDATSTRWCGMATTRPRLIDAGWWWVWLGAAALLLLLVVGRRRQTCMTTRLGGIRRRHQRWLHHCFLFFKKSLLSVGRRHSVVCRM